MEKRLPPDMRPMTNEEITVAILTIYEHLSDIMKMVSDSKKAPDHDVKINELAHLRARLKDFRPYG